jgi:hypothetical protein
VEEEEVVVVAAAEEEGERESPSHPAAVMLRTS